MAASSAARYRSPAAAGTAAASTAVGSSASGFSASGRFGDWRATVMGDGWVVVRHHDLQRVIEMTERFASDLRMYAG